MITEMILAQTAKTIKYVEPVPFGAATGLAAEVYQQMRADYLPLPVLMLHSPAPAVMAGVWSVLRESLLAGQVNRTLKEVVAATVSKINDAQLIAATAWASFMAARRAGIWFAAPVAVVGREQ